MRLSHSAYDRLLRSLPELYVCRTVPDLLDNAVRLLATIVVCDGCGWFVYAFGNTPKLVMSSESDPCFPAELIPRLGAVASSHPFVERWATIREPAALMLSDVPQRVFRRHHDEHRDFYACMGRHHLTVPVTLSATGAGALSFRAYRRSFTEEDRLVADLLRPHLQQAFTNAEIFTRATGMATGPLASTHTKNAAQANDTAWGWGPPRPGRGR